jgi:hypothetical protein
MNPKTFSTAALLSVYDGRHCVGFVLSHGKAGFEIFDQDERSCGLFPNQQDAIAALTGLRKVRRGHQ